MGSFSLSVAGYVVKAECLKFKQEEKCPNSSEVRIFSQK